MTHKRPTKKVTHAGPQTLPPKNDPQTWVIFLDRILWANNWPLLLSTFGGRININVRRWYKHRLDSCSILAGSHTSAIFSSCTRIHALSALATLSSALLQKKNHSICRVGLTGRCQPTLKDLTFWTNDLPNINIFWLFDEGTQWVTATRDPYVTTVPYPLTHH